MLFPPSDSTFNVDGPVVLRAMGGGRLLVVMINGTRLRTDPARREAAWLPAGAEFYRITIFDADGQAAHASVRIR